MSPSKRKRGDFYDDDDGDETRVKSLKRVDQMQDRYSVLLLDMASIHDHDATVLGTNNPGLLEPVPEEDWLDVPEGPLQDDPFVEGYWSDEDEDDHQQQHHHHHHYDSDNDSDNDSDDYDDDYDYDYSDSESNSDDGESSAGSESAHAHQSEETSSSNTLVTPPLQDDVVGSVEETTEPPQSGNTLGVYRVGNRWACPICHSTSKSRNDAKRHLATVHSGKEYLCPACDKSFNRRDAFKRHFEGKTMGACRDFMVSTLLPTETLKTVDVSRYLFVVDL
ncbi:predicted protein [Postia placenta Mad-698-R]|nr:predicted protein [Postia placenta Mad-698-R]